MHRRPGLRPCCHSRRRRHGSRAIPCRTTTQVLRGRTRAAQRLRCRCIWRSSRVPRKWRDEALAEKWRKVGLVRRVVTGALEIERSTSASDHRWKPAPLIHVSDVDLFAALVDVDLAELWITSAATLVQGEGAPEAFRSRRCRCCGTRCTSRKERSARGRGKSFANVGHRSSLSGCLAARCAGAA